MAYIYIVCVAEAKKWPTLFVHAHVMKWFVSLFQENDNSQSIHVLVASFLQKTGQDIVNGLMKACLFCLPTFMLSDAAEILYELMCIDRPVSNECHDY